MTSKRKKSNRQKLKGKKAFTAKLPLCMDSMLVQERNALDEQVKALETEAAVLDGARNRAKASEVRAEIADLDADLSAIEEKVAEETIEFVFRAIPSKSYNDLLRDHKPTDEQLQAALDLAEAEGKPKAAAVQMRYNPDTLPPALIAATLVDPKLTAEEVTAEIWVSDEWNESEKSALYEMARTVCNGLSLPR